MPQPHVKHGRQTRNIDTMAEGPMPPFLQIAILVLVQILLPAYFAGWLVFARIPDRAALVLHALYGAVYLAFLWLVGNWQWLSIHAAQALVLIFTAAAAFGLYRSRHLPWHAGEGRSLVRHHGASLGMIAVFLGLVAYAIAGRFPAERPVELAFPLPQGAYIVAHGGDNLLINHHNGNRSQRYALDIVGLNRFGARASGLFPADPNQYE
ncbi:MAG: hypothetical protein ACRECY_01615, partial [Phyllobacterium sp.]